MVDEIILNFPIVLFIKVKNFKKLNFKGLCNYKIHFITLKTIGWATLTVLTASLISLLRYFQMIR